MLPGMTTPAVRRLSRHQLVRLIKRRGITQLEIAQRAGVSQGYVCHVWGRKFRDSPKAEAVWKATEAMLADALTEETPR